ncbi:hypothetical protein Hanom_Chr17g01575501 [Helianthus anomalus]
MPLLQHKLPHKMAEQHHRFTSAIKDLSNSLIAKHQHHKHYSFSCSSIIAWFFPVASTRV